MRLDTKKLGAKISEYAVFIALVLLVVAMMIFADGFATSSNLLNLLRQAAFNGLIAFGMTLVLLSDGIDLSVGSMLCALGAMLMYLLAQPLRARKAGFYAMAICGVLFIATSAFAISSRNEMVKGKGAVIMSSSVSIKSSPDRAATELFVLHEGTTVVVGEKIEGWVEIRIADGRKGWIEESRIERI